MIVHPSENLDVAFRKWFEDRANILHRIEYVNPYINQFGIPLAGNRLRFSRSDTPYTGFIIKLVRNLNES
jgi:hypothetical protein